MMANRLMPTFISIAVFAAFIAPSSGEINAAVIFTAFTYLMTIANPSVALPLLSPLRPRPFFTLGLFLSGPLPPFYAPAASACFH